MDTRKLLEELENVINSANEVPFTNKKMVDKDEIERLIDAINQSLPNELESARRIVADKERIMLDAEKKAVSRVGAICLIISARWNSYSKSLNALRPLIRRWQSLFAAYSLRRPSKASTSTLGISLVVSLSISRRSSVVNM